MTKYICRECTGRTGDEHTFEVRPEPKCCPWCGKRDHIEPIEDYFRDRLNELERKR